MRVPVHHKTVTLQIHTDTAFVELVPYMQEELDIDESTPVFQLSELIELCTSRLCHLEVWTNLFTHETRL